MEKRVLVLGLISILMVGTFWGLGFRCYGFGNELRLMGFRSSGLFMALPGDLWSGNWGTVH